MDEIYTQKVNSEELTHWGIKGMKWGVRRFQNPDGSLTPAGKKRVAKLDAERKALTGRTTPFAKKASSLDNPSKTKKMEDMTDEELKRATNRARAEVEYSQTMNRLAELNPKKLTAGEKFAKLVEQKVLPTVVERSTKMGMDFLEKKIKDALGIKDSKADMDKLLEEAKLWEAKGKIAENKGKVDKRAEEVKKKQEAAAKAEKDAKEAAAKAKKDAKAEKDAKEAAAKTKAESKTDDDRSDEYETVILDGGGSKSESSSKKRSSKKDGPIYDAEWEEVSNEGRAYANSSDWNLPSSSVSGYITSGRSYLDYLLE